MNEEDRQLLAEALSQAESKAVRVIVALIGAVSAGAVTFASLLFWQPEIYCVWPSGIWLAVKIAIAPSLLGSGLLLRQPPSKEARSLLPGQGSASNPKPPTN